MTWDNLFNWFCYSNLKANTSKSHLLLSPFNAKSIDIKSSLIEGSSSKKLFGITSDRTLLLKKICIKDNLTVFYKMCQIYEYKKETSNI